jgi:hypothetical protein
VGRFPYKVDGAEHVVWEDEETGRLFCECGSKKVRSPKTYTDWCEHIEAVVRSGADAAPEAFAALPERLAVPMAPTASFWIIVGLGPVDDGMRPAFVDGGYAYENRVKLSKGISSITRPEVPEHRLHLCYLAPGEGRMVLRQMLFEWLRSFYRTAPPCNSKLHKTNPRWGRRDGRDTPIRPEDWPDLWCLIAEGKCRSCLTYSTNVEQDAPVLSALHAFDLIPHPIVPPRKA